jgi:hypothetical protein
MERSGEKAEAVNDHWAENADVLAALLRLIENVPTGRPVALVFKTLFESAIILQTDNVPVPDGVVVDPSVVADAEADASTFELELEPILPPITKAVEEAEASADADADALPAGEVVVACARAEARASADESANGSPDEFIPAVLAEFADASALDDPDTVVGMVVDVREACAVEFVLAFVPAPEATV